MNKYILEFVEKHKIKIEKVVDAVDTLMKLEPRAKIVYDVETYSEFGVLRVPIFFENYAVQPLLIGRKDNLTQLSKFLWNLNMSLWEEKMADISCFGTFKKKHILNPAVAELVKKYYKRDGKILDVGSGDGSLVDILYPEVGNNIYGCDLTILSVTHLKKKYPKIKDKFFVRDIILDDNSQDNSYQLIIASMILSNIVRFEDAIKNFTRLLSKDGVLIVVDVNPYYYKALGYEYDNKLIPLHNPRSRFYTEKFISGHTKAVHSYAPFGLYRRLLQNRGMKLLGEFVYSVDRKDLLQKIGSAELTPSLMEYFIGKSDKVVGTPPFYFVIMQKV